MWHPIPQKSHWIIFADGTAAMRVLLATKRTAQNTPVIMVVTIHKQNTLCIEIGLVTQRRQNVDCMKYLAGMFFAKGYK